MSSRPYMPLWIGDYRKDTADLSTEQHGAYLLLLMSMWVAGGFLKDDPVKLARIAGIATARRWARVWVDVEPLFQKTNDGRVTHKRVRRELRKMDDKSAARADAGRKGGQAKAKNGVEKRTKLGRNPTSTLPAAALDLFDNSKQLPEVPPSKTLADSRARAPLNTHSHSQTEASASDSLRSDERLPDDDPKAAELEFTLWYRHYPLKRARGQAERAFRAARKIASLQELIDGVERYKRDKRADRDWRYPATWLNGKDWLDEAEPERQHESTGPPAARQSREDSERAAWNKVLDDAAKGKHHG